MSTIFRVRLAAAKILAEREFLHDVRVGVVEHN